MKMSGALPQHGGGVAAGPAPAAGQRHLGFTPTGGRPPRPGSGGLRAPVSRCRAPQPWGSLPGAGDSPRISPSSTSGPGGTASPFPSWRSSTTPSPTALCPLNSPLRGWGHAVSERHPAWLSLRGGSPTDPVPQWAQGAPGSSKRAGPS